MILSLDVETYGACTHDMKGALLPIQTHFHPYRSLVQDKVPLSSLILCASITPIQIDGGFETGNFQPDSSMVFRFHQTSEKKWLGQWLKKADSLLLMNAQFDLLYLRTLPEFRYILDGSHEILDLSVINYLECEVRPERSLKNIGPVLRTHIYERTAANRFHNADDPKLLQYVAEDTHNTILASSELCRRISRRYQCSKPLVPSRSSPSESPLVGSGTLSTSNSPHASKLSPFCRQFYSDTIWSCVRMSEAGIPFSLNKLRELEKTTTAECEKAFNDALTHFNLKLEGEGSHKSKEAFIDLIISTIDGAPPCTTSKPTQYSPIQETPSTSSTTSELRDPSSSSSSSSSSSGSSVRGHPLLVLTDKTRQVSFSEENRRLLKGLLPSQCPLHQAMDLWGKHSSSQKLLSSYLYPLLHHRRNHEDDTSSKVIPCSQLSSISYLGVLGSSSSSSSRSSFSASAAPATANEIGLAFGSWYVVPTQTKDTTDDGGGTLQGRITIKKPSGQTFPPPIKKSISSRFGDEGCIAAMDLEQIELKVGTLLSKDAGMVAEYLKPKPDLHKGRAIYVWGPDVVNTEGFHSGEAKVDRRQWAKTLNFADFFLAAALRMQMTILELSGQLLPIEFFLEIERSRWILRPGLTDWQMKLALFAEKHGYLELPFTGQSRYFTGFKLDHQLWHTKHLIKGVRDGSKSLISEIVNFPVQTTAGNTMLRIQARLHQTLQSINHPCSDCYMFLNIYDCLMFDCKKSFLPTLKQLIEDAVTYVRYNEYWSWLQEMQGIEVPLTYDLKIK